MISTMDAPKNYHEIPDPNGETREQIRNSSSSFDEQRTARRWRPAGIFLEPFLSTLSRYAHRLIDRVTGVAYSADELEQRILSKVAAGVAPAWSGIEGKPDTFPPSAHTHVAADITDLPPSRPELLILDMAPISGEPGVPMKIVFSTPAFTVLAGGNMLIRMQDDRGPEVTLLVPINTGDGRPQVNGKLFLAINDSEEARAYVNVSTGEGTLIFSRTVAEAGGLAIILENQSVVGPNYTGTIEELGTDPTAGTPADFPGQMGIFEESLYVCTRTEVPQRWVGPLT